MANATHSSAPFTQKKPLDESAICKIAQREAGFRINIADIKQAPLKKMALNLVQKGKIYQANRMGDIVVYRAEDGECHPFGA